MSLSPTFSGTTADPIAMARPALFVAILALAWATLEPFPSLQNTDVLELNSGREGLTYAAYAAVAALAGVVVWLTQRRALTALVTPWSVALAVWLVFSVVTSLDGGSSMRRFVLTVFVAVIAASLFLLADGRRQFALLLGGGMATLVVLSLFGVAVLPNYAVHQATDIVEPQLAGDWRGIFSHKNAAAAVFAMGVFIGIYAARAGNLMLGIATAALCFVFVVMSGGKSALMLTVVTLAVTGFVAVVPSTFLRVLAMLAPLVILFLLGPGALLNETLGGIVRSLPIDVTFTGRVDIWAFAFEKIAERPITGYGFAAFWSLEETRFGAESSEQWAGSAAHAHNGYIDAALNIGLPGLALTLIVLVFQPIRDFLAARRGGADDALSMMLLQVFLCGTYLAVMEAFMFVRTDPIWITFLFAVFGLRYLARFPNARA